MIAVDLIELIKLSQLGSHSFNCYLPLTTHFSLYYWSVIPLDLIKSGNLIRSNGITLILVGILFDMVANFD